MSVMVAVGRGATAGVLVKQAEALEVLERVDTLVVDKTGTLTEGRPRLVSVEVAPGLEEREALALAAGLEQASEHPLAAAIVEGARARGLVPSGATEFHARPGKGVTGAGDGVNDAPALAAAHVGIAMGTGADVALEAAGVTLVRGDLQAIVRARRLSRAAMRNIRENLFFAFVYNALGVPIATGVLYPVWGLLLNPMIASAAMSLSSVAVIGNALRLRRLAL